MKKFINLITVRLFGAIVFKSEYKYPNQKIDFWNIINFQIKQLSDVD